MTRINLLPWREALRKERQRQFVSIGAGAAILMAAIILYLHIHISGMIGTQEARNTFLQGEIDKVDASIKEIAELDVKKKKLLQRMTVIQDLQSRRPLAVHMIDELVRVMPEGLYLTKITQKEAEIELEGVAQSNARVSSLMNNLEKSEWFKDPRLDVIQAQEGKEAARGNRFLLKVSQRNPADPNGDRDPNKTEGKKGGKGKAGGKK
ncbi:MAG: PilN domain-containing protein [Gammaproteobacteria bacterium]|nr:PilN domain-containing protein [Gammaproteobacteria bacterium]